MAEQKFVDAAKRMSSWANDQGLLFEHIGKDLEKYILAAEALAEAFSPKTMPMVKLLRLSVRLFHISVARILDMMERVNRMILEDMEPALPDEHPKNPGAN